MKSCEVEILSDGCSGMLGNPMVVRVVKGVAGKDRVIEELDLDDNDDGDETVVGEDETEEEGGDTGGPLAEG
jgi:hypothetical protein